MVGVSQASKLIRIAIVGKGAIGIILGQYIAKAYGAVRGNSKKELANPLSFLIRNKKRYTDEQTLTIKESLDSIAPLPIQAKLTDISSLKSSNFDCLLLPIKCYQVSEFCQQYQLLVKPSTTLFLLQNGMGGGHTLRAYFPTNPILAGTTTDAGFKASSLQCQQTASGKLDLGWFDTPVEQQDPSIAQFFLNCHPNAVFHEQIEWALFRKLCVNAIINPLCSVKNIKNGGLLNHLEEVRALFEEVWIALLDITADQIKEHIDKEELLDDIMQVIKLTRNNSCSMREDLIAGRPTELEGILGFLLNNAPNADFCIIRELYLSIKKLETSGHK